ncbi:MAG: VOC family protein [Candidatus Saccharibacteria bacterium]|nr:VOC family protein [Candidatus Saccharibacteria bacterium]
MITKFLHTAFTVNDLDAAIAQYASLGFKLQKQFEKPEPHAMVAHVANAEGITFEIWQFIDSQHPQVEFIKRHIAFESDNLEVDLTKYKELGFEEVIPITQGVSMRYAFVRDQSGNCIEIGQR